MKKSEMLENLRELIVDAEYGFAHDAKWFSHYNQQGIKQLILDEQLDALKLAVGLLS